MLTLLIVRHGQTHANLNKIAMGQTDSPLTSKGEEDAHALAKKLQNTPFDNIYSSDLERALQTAKILASNINPSAIAQHPALREIDYGKFNNSPYEVMEKNFGKYEFDVSFRYPQGESLIDVQKRIVKFLKLLKQTHPNQTLLLVTHRGTIYTILSHLQKIPLQDFIYQKPEIPHTYIGKFTF